ncbi:MAG: MFS transporter, partial [Cyclobacteriaceae bacterium]|nr:MFS transporter [Cyclobacteriaceae bacterium]
AVWGLGQLFTGKLADHFNKKKMLFLGMFGQAIALFYMLWADKFMDFVVLSVILGAGTALVYPTFLAGIADYTHPQQRAKSIGVFRLWRDLGYAVGAILTGVIADIWGILPSIGTIGALTLVSSIIILIRMTSKNEKPNDCISKDQVHLLQNTSNIIILDVRGSEDYNELHIDGALNIPLDTLKSRLTELKKADLVITACGKGGGRSTEAALLLTNNGINAKWLCGGTLGWYNI